MKSLRRVMGIGMTAAAVLGAACSSEDTAPPPPTAGGGGAVAVEERDPVTGNVDFYMPSDSKPALLPGADPAQAAIEYLQQNGEKLGIPNAKESYKPAGAGKDEDDGTTHVKLQQVSNGIEIWGVLTTVHFDENGFVDAVDGTHIPNLDAIAKQVPTVDEAAAKVAAEADARAMIPGTLGVTLSSANLVIYVDDDYANPRLARHVRVNVRTANSRQAAEVFIDALDASVLDSWNDSSDADEQREARAEGLDGEPHQTPVVSTGGIFRHGRIKTATQSQLITGRFKGEGDKEEWLFFESDKLEGPWDRHAVSAVLNLDRTERFYQQELKYEGPSGKRSNIFVAVREENQGKVNAYAYWSDNGEQDTITFTPGYDGERSTVVALDVVGHEFTHLVTAYNSKLVYRRQPGAINEAISDIFGAFIERKFETRSDRSFLVGEDKGEAWRDMRHPKPGFGNSSCKKCVDNYRDVLGKGEKPVGDPQKKTYNDNAYVHSNSSIVNNAWALIVEGGVNDTSKQGVRDGIGWDRSIKLWWKTQRHLLTPRMTIPRLGRLQSGLAKKSKGRFDPEIVACSWAAVDAVSQAWARNTLKLACVNVASTGGSAGSGGGTVVNLCEGKADGTYCNPDEKLLGFTCKAGAVTKGLQCPPPLTKCTGASPDGASLVCDP